MSGGAYFEQFIDDYFAECDEHLATVRRVLLAIDTDEPPTAIHLQDLARALHTLKGLSGMVGLAPAEQTAHAMEEAVRAIASSTNHRPLVEALFDGESVLESTINARRAGAEIPSASDYADRVQQLLSDGSASQLQTSAAPSLALTPARPQLCRFEFVPSAELAARGVGVELIRKRLSDLGEISGVVPRVQPQGGVAFDFLVRLDGGSLPDDRWRDDGLTWEWEAEAAPVVSARGAAPAPAPAGAVGTNVVRVDLNRLDDLMRLVGELVITRSRLGETLSRFDAVLSNDARDELLETNERIERQLRTIREGVMRIRLVPVGEVFERMRFAMRDVAREAGKQIRLEFSGQETEIDKLVVDRMMEPLLHLVRNSASHGIESPAERRARGKPVEGVIALRAQTSGDRIVLQIEDDGAGIDPAVVARRAVAMDLIAPNTELLPDALLDVICTPGFSTRETADMASGRGVGMAVVRTTIRALGGELFVHSEIGKGTRFTIELPLTLMITDALIVEIGDQPMAIPQVALREIVPLDPAAVTQLENNTVLSYRDRVLPLVDVAGLFQFTPQPSAKRHVLVVGSDTHPAGLVVDRILGLREIVVHPLTDPLTSVPGVTGATELSDGRVSLILDAAALLRWSHDRGSTRNRARIQTLPPSFTSKRESSWS